MLLKYNHSPWVGDYFAKENQSKTALKSLLEAGKYFALCSNWVTVCS